MGEFKDVNDFKFNPPTPEELNAASSAYALFHRAADLADRFAAEDHGEFGCWGQLAVWLREGLAGDALLIGPDFRAVDFVRAFLKEDGT